MTVSIISSYYYPVIFSSKTTAPFCSFTTNLTNIIESTRFQSDYMHMKSKPCSPCLKTVQNWEQKYHDTQKKSISKSHDLVSPLHDIHRLAFPKYSGLSILYDNYLCHDSTIS